MDFRLEQNGKAQALATFEEVTAKLTPVKRMELPDGWYTNEISGDPSPKPLDFIVMAFDPTGKRNSQISRNFRANLNPEAVEQITVNGVRYENSIKVPPGRYGVLFVVRDNLNGVLGSVRVPLKAE